jgi:hypothetical protein
MGYALAPGVSFCRVSGRLLFLDVDRDRYFCLSLPAEEAFSRWTSGEALTQEERARLDRLAKRGPLRRCDAALPPAPVPSTFVTGSVLDRPLPPAAPAAIAAAGARLLTTAVRLRVRGLGSLLRAVRRRKARAWDARRSPEDPLAQTAAAFEALSMVAAAHDRCLVRSVAAARRLLALGVRPDLVIGVRLQPFKAHCWVQHGDQVVNDRVDVVRAFTPILVL